MLNANSIRIGNIINFKKKLCAVVKTAHTQPGKGGAYVQMELKDIITGTKYTERFRSEDKIEKIRLDERELQMHLEFKRKELEDADAMRDAQRNMAWFALAGMLLYPSLVVICELTGLDQAGKILGDMAPTYFVSVAVIVAAFYGKEALMKKK